MVTANKNLRVNKELKRILREFHDVSPDVILINLTSAVNPAFVLKEAWKSAYPNEKTPVFLGVDPRKLGALRIRSKYDEIANTNGTDEADNFVYQEINKGGNYIKKIGANIAENLIGKREINDEVKDKRLLVFDECSSSSTAYGEYNYIDQKLSKGLSPMGSPEYVAYALASYCGFEDIWINGGASGEYLYKTLPSGSESQLYHRDDKGDSKRQLRGKKGNFVISELKKIGRKVGEEINEEDFRKKSRLEKIVASFLFLSLGLLFLINIKYTGMVVSSKSIINDFKSVKLIVNILLILISFICVKKLISMKRQI